jgi:hypothetical protein
MVLIVHGNRFGKDNMQNATIDYVEERMDLDRKQITISNRCGGGGL